jgi:hypothetical protein
VQIDETLGVILDKVCEKHGVSREKLVEALDLFFSKVGKKIRNLEPVTIVNLGIFKLDPRRTVRRVLKMIGAYRKSERLGDGSFPREEFLRKFEIQYKVHQAARAHSPRVGRRWKNRHWREWYSAKYTNRECKPESLAWVEAKMAESKRKREEKQQVSLQRADSLPPDVQSLPE